MKEAFLNRRKPSAACRFQAIACRNDRGLPLIFLERDDQIAQHLVICCNFFAAALSPAEIPVPPRDNLRL
jgi:hypothetical protein